METFPKRLCECLHTVQFNISKSEYYIFEFDEQSYANDLPLDSSGFQVTASLIGFYRHGGLRRPTHLLFLLSVLLRWTFFV